MAKAKDLAALAGLAGLAYAYNKNKGDKDDAGDQKTSSYTGDTKKVAASDDRMSNEDYIKSRMKKAPEDEKGSAQSDVLKTVTAPKSASNDKAGNQGVLPQKSSTVVTPKPRGMTGAQNDTLATSNKQSKATSENNALAKVNRGMGREVTEAAKANATPAPTTSSKVADTVKTVAKAVAQGPIGVATDAAKPVVDEAVNKFKHEMPISKIFKSIREAGNRGNPDVKLASGGMTASRRGDGIAQRGKTRGKMC